MTEVTSGLVKRVRDGKEVVYMNCPKCGNAAALDDHTISQDGIVNPSVVCPFDGCDFHDYVKIVDYKP